MLADAQLSSSLLYCIVFIHFYSASHSMSLSEALPTTAIDTVSEFTRQSTMSTIRLLAIKGLHSILVQAILEGVFWIKNVPTSYIQLIKNGMHHHDTHSTLDQFGLAL